MDFGGGTGGVKSYKIRKVFLKKLGSGLGLWSSRSDYPAQNLRSIIMVPGGRVFMGGRQGGFFAFKGVLRGGQQ